MLLPDCIDVAFVEALQFFVKKGKAKRRRSGVEDESWHVDGVKRLVVCDFSTMLQLSVFKFGDNSVE